MSTARQATFAELAKRQRQIYADATANEAVRHAIAALDGNTDRAAALAQASAILEKYATPYGRLLAAGALPIVRQNGARR